MVKIILFSAALAINFFLYMKYVWIPDQQFKNAQRKFGAPKEDTINDQDDDFCAIAVAISKSTTDIHFEVCAAAVYKFQSKYRSLTGNADTQDLAGLLEDQQEKILGLANGNQR